MVLSDKQQEALEMAQKHGGKLMRWKQGGYWTYLEAIQERVYPSQEALDLEWYCTTNTIFALVRRGYMMMDDWEHCSVIPGMHTEN
ncbi:hypothetical protein GRF59_26725 [Paenibacillus sp. HJL G12]|uniref:Uncharacterized protein n=1 Tax=Paenibacillus dendrobii TaxID=2691084 RepID=A0A7X3INH3_9BACL|nr:hypothetical protein [Paenibacillus dendrobii]MWV47193.1 hypothetical protein [Paenibacillus dendrobii]